MTIHHQLFSRLHRYSLLAAVLLPLLIFFIYAPGLSGGFVFDDFSNIVHPPGVAMQELSWDQLMGAATSMEGRPITRASFGLNYLFAGFDPYYFKLVNIAIHCINAILLLGLTIVLLNVSRQRGYYELTDTQILAIAATVSTAWAIHPVNLTNVLYAVQRMNSLSATFVLAGMLSYAYGRITLYDKPLRGWALILTSVLVFLPLAWFSKENGALLPIFLLILELAIFRFSAAGDRQRTQIYFFYIVVLVIPAMLAILYIIQNPGMFHGGYHNRYFSLTERLLTEPRVLWIYIRMILLPTPSVFGLFHDDIPLSTSLLAPATTVFSIGGLIGLFVIGLYLLKKQPLVGFGILFFLAGHLMESSFIPLELAFEHRNYLPSFGLILPVFFFIVTAGKDALSDSVRIVIIVLLLLFYGWQTYQRSLDWSDNITLFLTEVHFHPQSVRANYEAGKVYGQWLERGQGDARHNYLMAIMHFQRVTALRKNSTSGLFGSILASIDSDEPVQAEWIDELANRLAQQPLEQVNLRWLDKMTECVNKGKCKKDVLQVPRLIQAALSFQHINRKNRSNLYAILAKYEYMVVKDIAAAISSAQQSVSQMPSNLYHRLNLVKFLVIAKRYDEATEEMDKLAKLDDNNQLADELQRLRSDLINNTRRIQ